MKKFTFLLAILITVTLNAQIPNSGFENWTLVGIHLEPQGFLTTNSYATTAFYPITRSTDHYPASIGSYSLRIENNLSLLPNFDALGLVLQNSSQSLLDGPSAAFPIEGHPTSLTGYYKFQPLNGDTMIIQIQLTNSDLETDVTGRIIITEPAPDWTSFNIPIPTYVNADSASIVLAAYNADGAPPEYVPHGNSVLYIDNLNFDHLITSVSEQISENNAFEIFPNPASNFVTLNIDNQNNDDIALNIYNIRGDLVKTEMLKQNRQINIENLSDGIYMVEIKSKAWTRKQKLIIQK